jgi:hypothetical protein
MVTNTPGAFEKNNVLPANFGPNIDIVGISGKIVAANPLRATTELINAAEINGNIALVERNLELDNFGQQVRNCQKAGAIGVIIFDSIYGPQVTMEDDREENTEITIPSVFLSKENGLLLLNNLVEASQTTIKKLFEGDIIDGEWLVGIVKESRVREVLNLPIGPVPIIGYLNHRSSESSLDGNTSSEPWYDIEAGISRQNGTYIAGKMIEYFNNRNVQHIFLDIRNTTGGLSDVMFAFVEHCGSDRFYTTLDTSIKKQQNFDDTGVNKHISNIDIFKTGEILGTRTYKYIKSFNDCCPSCLKTVLPSSMFIGGPVQNPVPGFSTKRNILMLMNESTTSATQGAYIAAKGASIPPVDLTKNRYGGDWGNNVQFIGYGCYDRPFCSGGSYPVYLNWYGVGKVSHEQLKIAPFAFVERVEGDSDIYKDGRTQYNTVAKNIASFSDIQQPNILWNMNATVLYQDIGYTKDNSVDVVKYGEPWIEKRYEGIDYENPLTWRDTAFEKIIKMVVDPNVEDNFFKDNGYGYL